MKPGRQHRARIFSWWPARNPATGWAPRLIAAIKRRNTRVTFSGVGGAHMAAEGSHEPVSARRSGDHGLCRDPARACRKSLRRIRETADAVVAARPDVLVIIDSPEFTHRVARRVRAARAEIPIVDYVCPSVWAWRPGRARAMRAYVDHVLALLPFEPAAMPRLGGPPCTFVGHPLSERVGDLRPNAEEARRRLADPPLLLVLPGSRAGEIRRMAGVFGDAVALVAARSAPWRWWCRRCRGLPARCARRSSWRVRRDRGRPAGRKGRGLPHRAGGADQIRHLDARTGGRRRPDGRGLQGVACWRS